MREPPDLRLMDAGAWRKSSHSSADNGCVEVARPTGPIVGIRDSKAPDTGRLMISPVAFEAFLELAAQ